MENPKKEEKRAAILEVAKAEFAHRGYHGCSIADIARRAEVAAGTIYLYFGKKEDLLVGLFRKYLGGFLTEARPALAEVPAGGKRLRRLIELQFGFFEKDPELARVIQVYLRERNPYIRDGVRPTLLDYFGLLHEMLESGVACGAFDSSLDIRLARKVLFGALDEVVTSWVLSERRYSLFSLVDPLCRMLLRTLGGAAPASQPGEESSERKNENS